MAHSEDGIKALFHDALGEARNAGWSDGKIAQEFHTLLEKYEFAEYVYEPDQKLQAIVAEYKKWCQDLAIAEATKNRQQLKVIKKRAGILMEELVFLAFNCLKGKESIKSFQSYSAQHDLVISGSVSSWYSLVEMLHLPRESRTFVIEAKNIQDKVNDQQFSRLCSVMQFKFDVICSLGIFFSRLSATGFPIKNTQRQRSLRDSRATQVLFHAKTRKFVVVLDHDDILQLDQPGSLPRILEAKIRDVEETSGLPLNRNPIWNEIDLPSHLQRHM